MKILVTGAAGFIGAHVVKALVEREHEVVGVDNFNDYYSPAYKQARVEALIGGKAEIERVDITDKEALEKVFKAHSFDLICHLAAQAGVRYSMIYPEMYHKVNVGGTLNVLEACRKCGINKIVLASSSSVYGNNPVPWSEDQKTDQPISHYAATKRAAEGYAYAYHHMYDLKFLVLRFFTVFGPWGRPDMAYFRVARAIALQSTIGVYGEGKMTRDFTYIDDIVNGVLSAVSFDFDRAEKVWEVINLGNSKPVNLLKFVETIERFYKPVQKKMMPMQPGDMRDTFANIDKASKHMIGFQWKPQYDFSAGVQEFVEWFKKYEGKLRDWGVV